MGRPRKELPEFADWLVAKGYSTATVNQYTYWVRQVTRALPELNEDALGALLRTTVPPRYHAACRAAWRSLRDFSSLRGIDVPDFPAAARPIRQADLAPVYREAEKESPLFALPADEAFRHAVGGLLAVGGIEARYIPGLTWAHVRPYAGLAGFCAVSVPDPWTKIALVPKTFLDTLLEWKASGDPADAPLVPAERGSHTPMAPELVRAILDARRAVKLRSG